MSHPTERANAMKAINTRLLNDIEEARIRQLHRAYWADKPKETLPSLEIVLSISILTALLLASGV